MKGCLTLIGIFVCIPILVMLLLMFLPEIIAFILLCMVSSILILWTLVYLLFGGN